MRARMFWMRFFVRSMYREGDSERKILSPRQTIPGRQREASARSAPPNLTNQPAVVDAFVQMNSAFRSDGPGELAVRQLLPTLHLRPRAPSPIASRSDDHSWLRRSKPLPKAPPLRPCLFKHLLDQGVGSIDISGQAKRLRQFQVHGASPFVLRFKTVE